MKQIYLSHESGNLFKVCVVRYFHFKNNVYLIYTLNEKDTKDYIKLYVVKVMKELGELVTQTVRRQDEWQAMKNLIKRILSELKKGDLRIVTDLDVQELEEVVIYENRSFSLASDLVNLLTSPAKQEIIEIPVENRIDEINIPIANTIPLGQINSLEKNTKVENITIVTEPDTQLEVLELEEDHEETEILEINDDELEEVLEIDEEEFIESLELESEDNEVEVLNI